jgi:di/tricarboxylate transporter
LDWRAGVAVAVVGAVLSVLALTRVPPYLVLLGGLVTLLLAGVLTAPDALAGFANEGVVTVGVLFVVVAGLRQTGVMGALLHRLLGRPRSERAAQTRLAAPVVVASAFINNTPVVAMLMPVVLAWGRRVHIPPSRLMIPLSYAAVLGGLVTLIGTSTNLVVGGLWAAAGHTPMRLFTITPVGLPVALAGLLFMVAFARRLLPARGGEDPTVVSPREYTVEMLVEGSGVAGRTVARAGLNQLPGVVLTEAWRGGAPLPDLGPDTLLKHGDRLRFAGLVSPVAELQRLPGLSPATRQEKRLPGPRAERVFAEAVVSRAGPLAGKTVLAADFRRRYGAVALAVARGGERIPGPLDDVELRPGDTLFLEAPSWFVARQRLSADFALVSRVDGEGPATRDRAWAALAILAGMAGAAATGVLTMLQAAFAAALLMLLTRACSEETALRHVDWPLLLAIGASLGLGRAVDQTGAAAALAGGVLRAAGDHPWTALAAVYLVTTIVTEIVTNNAAAVIVFPIAMATAARLGVDPMPFAVCVMIAASAAFASPLGYQTHLMVYGAGGYRVSDFMRIGVPMNIVVGVVAVGLIPVVFPF